MRNVTLHHRQGPAGEDVIEVILPPERGRAPATPHPRGRLYSPATVAILRLLCRETRWVTADTIAQDLKLPKDRVVVPILTELGQDGCQLVESKAGNQGGYMLDIPVEEHPDEYRRKFSAWLDLIDPPR